MYAYDITALPATAISHACVCEMTSSSSSEKTKTGTSPLPSPSAFMQRLNSYSKHTLDIPEHIRVKWVDSAEMSGFLRTLDSLQ